MRNLLSLIIVFSFACNQPTEKTPTTAYVIVLGVAQDAGYPQMNCKKSAVKGLGIILNYKEILLALQ